MADEPKASISSPAGARTVDSGGPPHDPPMTPKRPREAVDVPPTPRTKKYLEKTTDMITQALKSEVDLGQKQALLAAIARYLQNEAIREGIPEPLWFNTAPQTQLEQVKEPNQLQPTPLAKQPSETEQPTRQLKLGKTVGTGSNDFTDELPPPANPAPPPNAKQPEALGTLTKLAKARQLVDELLQTSEGKGSSTDGMGSFINDGKGQPKDEKNDKPKNENNDKPKDERKDKPKDEKKDKPKPKPRRKPETSIEMALAKQIPSGPIALASDFGYKQAHAARLAFCNQLIATSVEARVDNKLTTVRFDEGTALYLTGLFLGDTFGQSGPLRFLAIVRAYSTAKDGEVEPSSIRLAELKSQDPDILPQLRRFYAAYKQSSAAQNHSTVSPELRGFWTLVGTLELISRFAELRSMANRQEKEFVDILKAAGYSTSRGKGWSSIVKEYLAAELQTPATSFSNALQVGTALSKVVDTFGRGVLCFLPDDCLHKLNRIGVSKVEEAMKILAGIVPVLSEVCKVAEDNVVEQMLAGKPIRIPTLKITKTPLLGRLEEAIVHEDPEDTEMSDADAESDDDKMKE